MKNVNPITSNRGFSLQKSRIFGATLFLFALFFAGGLQAQGPCSGISFTFEQYEDCKFRARYTNTSECFIEIRYILQSGTFAPYVVNSAAGFTVQEISPSELWIHHNQGFVPLGNQVPLLFTLPHDLNTIIDIAYLDDCAQVGCEIFGGIPIESCPDLQDASITGVKYRECGASPYTNQATLSGWTMQLQDEMGNVVAEQVTGTDGSYAFFDLHAGIYIVKETQQPGWTPKVPASGQTTVDLSASEHEVRNFGNCPPCSCDSVYLYLNRVAGTSDTSTYYLNINNSGEYCFSYVDVKVDSGQLITWNALLPGWTTNVLGANAIRLTPPDAYLPGGSSIPLSLVVSGIEHQNFTLSAYMDNGMGGVECKRSYSFPGLPMPFSTDCCPSGTIQGPELVTDGTFDAATPQFSWTGYNYVLAGGSGNIFVVTSAQIPTLNNQWICPSKSGLPTDPFLFVDGSSTAGAFVWEQQPSAPITPNTQYSFSATVNNLYLATLPATPDPTVELSIVDASNNIVFQTLSILPENPDQWVQVCGLWTSPSSPNAPYTLRIRTTSTGASGNDFAVDCISFRSCSVPCTASFNFTDNTCGNFSFTGIATGTPNFSYSWDFGDPPSGALNFSTLANPVHQYTSSGPHIVMVTITDGTGCIATYSASISVPTFPTSVSIAGNLSYCQGQSTVLTVSGGPWLGCLWSNSGSNQSTVIFTPGTYCVTCTDLNGCTATGCVTVIELPVPSASITGNLNICVGQSTTLIASGGGNYFWTPGGSNNATVIVSPTVTTPYTVLITSANNCTATSSVTVTVNPLPVFTLTNQTICIGQSATLTAAGGGTYLWSPGGATTPSITISPTTSTTYTVLVTSPLGCTKTGSATVTVNPLPVFTLTNQTICIGQSATLTAAGGGTYLWNPGGAITPAITINPTTTTTYTVLVTSPLGCTKTGSATVTVNPLPAFTLTNQAICIGQSATLTAAGGGTYLWNPGGATTPSITVNPIATTTYTVLVTSPLGCTKTGSATVTVNPLPVFTLSNQTICAGQSATLTATGGGTYLWSPGGAITAAITISPTATTTYTVLVTSPLGCTKTGSATVTVNPLPNANAGLDQEMCVGQGPVFLSASGGTWFCGSYNWSFPTNQCWLQTVSPNVTTTYSVTVYNNFTGCTATDQVTVVVHQQIPVANPWPDQTMCTGQTATLTASATGGTIPYTYQWYTWNQNTYIVSPSSSQTYTVTITDANGCTATDAIDVKVMDCCQSSIVDNWDFSLGSPQLIGYNQIDWANGWDGIWSDFGFSNQTSNRTGDYWGSGGTPSPYLPPCYGQTPTPSSQGNYGGFMCMYAAGSIGKINRQGILNKFKSNATIAPNSGYYLVSMKVACPCLEIGTPKMVVYGVTQGETSTIHIPIFPNGPFSFYPSNGYLFKSLFSAGAKELMTLPIANSACTNNFMTVSGIFNSSTLSNPIDRIFLTRKDAVAGFTYLAIDDVCIEKLSNPTGDPCDCGAFTTGTIYQSSTGYTRPIRPFFPAANVQLPCNSGGNVTLTGSLACNSSWCSSSNFNSVTWVLTGPNGTTTGNGGASYPNFVISLPASAFPASGGVFSLVVTRQCGTKTCRIRFNFMVAACPCLCDSTFYQNVNQGFSVVSPTSFSSCARNLKPVALCASDIVEWHIAGVGNFGPSFGNNVYQIGFPGPGVYQVCMFVRRIVNGATCGISQKCQQVIVNCLVNPVPKLRFCDGISKVKNGDFRDSMIIAGFMGESGVVPEWDLAINHGEGQVFAEDSSGANDEGHLVLTGGKDNFAGIFQEVDLSNPDGIPPYIIIEFFIKNFLGVDVPDGTNLEVRLQSDPFPGAASQILHKHEVDTSSGWQRKVLEIEMSPDTSLKYLIICLQSDDTSRRSVIGLDNLQICTSETPLSYVVETRKIARIRIFPNPNSGAFKVELPEPAIPNMRFHIVSLTGQMLREQSIQTGNTIHTVQAGDLPAGLYFLQVLSEGKVLAVEKFVKQ